MGLNSSQPPRFFVGHFESCPTCLNAPEKGSLLLGHNGSTNGSEEIYLLQEERGPASEKRTDDVYDSTWHVNCEACLLDPTLKWDVRSNQKSCTGCQTELSDPISHATLRSLIPTAFEKHAPCSKFVGFVFRAIPLIGPKILSVAQEFYLRHPAARPWIANALFISALVISVLACVAIATATQHFIIPGAAAFLASQRFQRV